ncbi:MAG: HDOD domain-containing protein [Arcobacter butzleri]|nr:HDOD domain-containing protein [Aliarcobacter butzleri]
MYMETIMKKIDSLPPLPQTLIRLQEFKEQGSNDIKELISIIEKDPLTISTLLKVANSAMFGFVSKIETPSRAVNLLGIDFTISIALASNISKAVNTNLQSYGKQSDDFLDIANLQTTFINLWISKVDPKLKDELIIPAFLQESGKFLISDIINTLGVNSSFLQEVNSRFDDITSVEKEFIGITTSEITAAIFRHWNLTPSIINTIRYSDEPLQASTLLQKYAQVLYIAKLICNIIKPFDQKVIDKALKDAQEFGYEEKPLKEAILKLQEKIKSDKE